MTTSSRPYRFLRTALNAFISVRERQAEAYMNGALLMLDDETLHKNGYSRRELRRRPSQYPIF